MLRSRSEAERRGRKLGKEKKSRCVDEQQQQQMELERIRQDYIKYEHCLWSMSHVSQFIALILLVG